MILKAKKGFKRDVSHLRNAFSPRPARSCLPPSHFCVVLALCSVQKHQQIWTGRKFEKGIWMIEVSVEYSGVGFSQEGLDWLEWLEGRKIAFSKIFRRSTFHWPWVAPNFSFILPTWQNSFRNPTIQYQTQVPKTPWRAPWKRSVCQPLGQANPVWHVLGWRVIKRKDDI